MTQGETSLAGAVLAVASFGLPHSSARPPDQPLSHVDWVGLLARVRAERLTGLLAFAVASGGFPALEDQADEAQAAHREQMAYCLRLERGLLEIVELLDADGIEHRVLKGPAVARLDYALAALRPYVDVDLLVPPHRFDDAAAMLVSQGFERRFPEPRPGFDRRFGKGASFRAPNSVTVDLHRTLVAGPFGLTVDLEDAWAGAEEIVVGERPLKALGPVPRMLHASLHAVIGDYPPRLLVLRDVAQMLPLMDTGVLEAMARRWRATAVVRRSVELATSHLQWGSEVPAVGWARGLREPVLERRLLATATSPSRTYGTQLATSVVVIPGVRDRLAFVRAVVAPSRDYLQERHRDRARRLLTALHELIALPLASIRRARGSRGGHAPGRPEAHRAETPLLQRARRGSR